jgi:hypothetical protein
MFTEEVEFEFELELEAEFDLNLLLSRSPTVEPAENGGIMIEAEVESAADVDIDCTMDVDDPADINDRGVVGVVIEADENPEAEPYA